MVVPIRAFAGVALALGLVAAASAAPAPVVTPVPPFTPAPGSIAVPQRSGAPESAGHRPPAVLVAPYVVPGTFAIAGARPELTAELDVTPRGPLSDDVAIVQRRAGRIVRDYTVEMTKEIHLVVISDDWTYFRHLHPALDPDGRFTIALRFPHPGAYQVYSDTQPRGLAQQVFRFPLVVGTGGTPVRMGLPDATGTRVAVGPYVVALGTDRLAVGHETMIPVTITRDGKPAAGLRPYLGGAAHAIVIDARTLDYLHAHPIPAGPGATPAHDEQAAMGDMAAMPALAPGATIAPHLVLHVRAPSAGTYKLWLQFQAPAGLEVAPFVMTAG